jgi:ABC-type transport system involved in cytochrome c biogenesis permease subunit
MSKGALVLLLLFSFSVSKAQQHSYRSSESVPVPVNVPVNSPRAITPERADTLARKQVVYNGRIAPLRTLALDFCQKVTGKRSFGGLSAQQLMLSIMLYPDDWQHVRLIKVEDETLRHSLGIEGRYASMADFFNPDGTYRMSALYQRHKSTDDAMEKAILKVDERCALIVMLLRGELITPVPQGVERPSEALVTAELIYDAAPWSLILFIASFILAILSLLPFIFKRFPFPKTQKLSSTVIVVAKPRNVAKRIVASLTRVSFPLFPFPLTLSLSLATLYLLRWVIQGHIPLSNGYETMLFIALISSLFATFTSFRSHSLLSSLALIVTAFTLLVSHLSFMSPEMTPLMPVLQSPLLSIHVSVIMCAYALFALITLLSVVGLLSSHFSRFAGAHSELPPLRGIEGVLLYPAVFLLTTGIFLGAIWANVSWGTYWSWDPKETWALITLMIYAVPLHAESMPQFRNPRFYHLYMIFAFLSVLTTYFGVNYLLGGMHSYA